MTCAETLHTLVFIHSVQRILYFILHYNYSAYLYTFIHFVYYFVFFLLLFNMSTLFLLFHCVVIVSVHNAASSGSIKYIYLSTCEPSTRCFLSSAMFQCHETTTRTLVGNKFPQAFWALVWIFPVRKTPLYRLFDSKWDHNSLHDHAVLRTKYN